MKLMRKLILDCVLDVNTGVASDLLNRKMQVRCQVKRKLFEPEISPVGDDDFDDVYASSSVSPTHLRNIRFQF